MTANAGDPAAPGGSRSAVKIGLVLTGIAAVGTLLGGLAGVLPGQGEPSSATEASGSGTNTNAGSNSVNADNGGIGVGGDNTGCIQVADCVLPFNPAAADDKIVKAIRRDKDPQGKGPWAFNVLQDQGDGLFVRTGSEQADQRIGLATHASLVWVDCVTTSDFDADPSRKVGPTWYRGRWPSTTPSEVAMVGQPSNPSQGYAFKGYLAPNGHNGKVPQCG